MQQIGFSPVVGRFSDQTWSQVAVFGEPPVKGSRWRDEHGGVVFLAFRLSQTAQHAAGEVGQTWLHALESYFETQSLADIQPRHLLQDLTDLWPDPGGELGIVLLRQEHIFLASYGTISVLLSRAGKTGTVLAGVDRSWRAMRGKMRVGDKWLLGTAALVGEKSDALVEEVFDASTAEGVGEDLVVQVQASDESAGVAGYVIFAHDVEKSVDKFGEKSASTPPAHVEQQVAHETAKHQPAIYVKSKDGKRKTALSVGLILLILLGTSVFFGWKRRVAAQDAEHFDEVMALVETQKTKAGELGSVHLAGTKEAIAEAETVLREAEEYFADNESYLPKITAALADLEEYSKTVTGEQEAGNVPLWFDLTIMRESFVGSVMFLQDESIFVLDAGNGLVGEVVRNTKEGTLVGGGELLRGATGMASDDQRVVVISSAGLVDVDVQAKTTALLVERDQAWGNQPLIGAFGGNIYLHVAGEQMIYRYSDGSDDGVAWFGPGVESTGNVVDMAIDGDVWLLGSDGVVSRYQRGAVQPYEQQVLDDVIGEARAMYVDPETERVYVLDVGKSRVVVYDYQGTYLFQQAWSGFVGVSDIAVIGQTLYALSGTDIYTMNLAQ